MVSHALILLAALVCALVLQWGVYAVVSRPHLLATPNERSSHTQPTPTMGGVVLVLLVLAYFIYLAGIDLLLGWGLFGSLLAVAVIGLWDDLVGLPATIRLLVHFTASVMVIYVLQLPLPGVLLAGLIVALVWHINLYNFMDGIDGYAAVQCLVFCLGVQIASAGVPGWPGDLVWLIAGAALGFLGFNWPPAKIFMGDVGSGFLGLLIGVLVLYLWKSTDVPLVASLILLAVFWFDATYTLCVRIFTRQAFTEAHRQHLYQHLALRRGHLWTTSVFILYAAAWLIPLAWLVTQSKSGFMLPAGALLAAVLPLAVLCWRYQAGLPISESANDQVKEQ